MRLIDADALAEQITDLSLDKYAECYGISVDALEDAPTIDALQVIRCKDCRYWDGYYCHNKWWGDGNGNYTPPIKKEDGYCYLAERKEE